MTERLLLGETKAETDAVVIPVLIVAKPVCWATLNEIVTITTTVYVVISPRWTIKIRLGRIVVVVFFYQTPILAPFCHIATHVINT